MRKLVNHHLINLFKVLIFTLMTLNIIMQVLNASKVRLSEIISLEHLARYYDSPNDFKVYLNFVGHTKKHGKAWEKKHGRKSMPI